MERPTSNYGPSKADQIQIQIQSLPKFIYTNVLCYFKINVIYLSLYIDVNIEIFKEDMIGCDKFSLYKFNEDHNVLFSTLQFSVTKSVRAVKLIFNKINLLLNSAKQCQSGW